MKILKKIFLYFLLFLFLILAGGTLLAYFYEDEIGKKAITELSKSLKTDLRVKKVDLSVFSNFPEASVNLNGILLEDTRKKELLKAERLSFTFGVWSLFGDNIEVKSVVIENGVLNLYTDVRGKTNYEILKENESTEKAAPQEETAGFAISLQEALLQNVLLRYQDDRSKFKIKTTFADARFSGQFSETNFALKSESDMLLHYLRSQGEDYLKGKKISYDAKIDVDLAEGKYQFERVGLRVNDNEFILDGDVEVENKFTRMDLLLTSDDAGLESVIQLLPEEYMNYLADFTSKGKFDFELWVKGKYSEREMPETEATFSLKDGTIRSAKLKEPLEDVNFDAKFTNGQYRNNKTSVFEIRDFSGKFAGEPVDLGLMIYNFDDPKLDFNLDGTLPLKTIYGLFDSPLVTDGAGEIRVEDFKIEGRLADMESMYGIKKVEATGKAIFTDAELTINKNKFSVENGLVLLDGNIFEVENLHIVGADSDLKLDGTFFNVLPVLFADEKNTKKAELEFDAKLTAERLNIGALADLTTETAEVPKSYLNEDKRLAVNDSLQAKGVEQRTRFTSLLKGKFAADIDEFLYSEINGKAFKGQLEFDNNAMSVKGRTDAMEGVFDLDGVMYFVNAPYLKAKLTCTDVNLKEFFRQSEDFGQEVLTSENLDGKIHAKIYIKAYFDRENKFLEDKLQVLAGIGITDGYLRDLEMLEAFSDYVKIEDLRNIKFTDLKNWLEIRNGRIFLPAMFIQSNALNMETSGEYTFEHQMDFNVKVNAAQILINSFRKHNKKLKPQPAKKKGFFNLYYKIHGDIDDFDYEMNKREVKRDMARSEHRRRAIRVALREEFGNLNLFEEPADWEDEGEEQPAETEYGARVEPEYIEGF